MDQQEEKQVQIQINQSLKNITWKESGIPTLTQQAVPSASTKLNTKSEYPDDFILDFDDIPTKKNGHKLDCTCKACIKIPRSEEAKSPSSLKADVYITPLNKKRI